LKKAYNSATAPVTDAQAVNVMKSLEVPRIPFTIARSIVLTVVRLMRVNTEMPAELVLLDLDRRKASHKDEWIVRLIELHERAEFNFGMK
jgi:hypothetical protein